MLSESLRSCKAVKTDTRVAMPKINQTELNADCRSHSHPSPNNAGSWPKWIN